MSTLPKSSQPEILDHGHVLIVDDDAQLRILVSKFLQSHGYQVSNASDGRVMNDLLSKVTIDLIILDVMLPGRSGTDLCRDVRKFSSVPIIMLTAKGDESDRIVGLEVGADDYVTKPFSSRELLARVRAVLRRSRSRDILATKNIDDIFSFDGWSLDLRKRELTSPGNVLVDLSTGEYNLLVAFTEHANRVLSRDMLMEFAKTRTSDPFDRTIDVQISRLRQKLASGGENSQMIKTVRGSGYMFTPTISNEQPGVITVETR